MVAVYDRTLSGSEVRVLMPAELGQPASLGLMRAGLALVGWTRRRRE